MEDKEYVTYDEAMEYLGIRRSTLYALVTDEGITSHKFKRDKRHYLARADVLRLKEIREKPWIASELTKTEAAQ